MLDGELHYLELVSLARLVQTGQLSPVEVTRALLSRIAELDVRLGSYVTVTAGRALSEARAAEREIGRGHIRGARDATITVRLRQAGAILLGKTQLTEGAYGQYPPPFTAPVNPWHPGYWPGASSSGSGVAVAAGLCFAALGTGPAVEHAGPAVEHAGPAVEHAGPAVAASVRRLGGQGLHGRPSKSALKYVDVQPFADEDQRGP